jgi:hypothetical protein
VNAGGASTVQTHAHDRRSFAVTKALKKAGRQADLWDMSAGLVTTLVLIYGGFSALGIAAGVSILRKAGYSSWWVVTGFIPVVNVVMVVAFAFADWPVLQERRRYHRLKTAEVVPDRRFSYAPAGPSPDQ